MVMDNKHTTIESNCKVSEEIAKMMKTVICSFKSCMDDSVLAENRKISLNDLHDGRLLNEVFKITQHVVRVTAMARDIDVTKMGASDFLYLLHCYHLMGDVKKKLKSLPRPEMADDYFLLPSEVVEYDGLLEKADAVALPSEATAGFEELHETIQTIYRLKKSANDTAYTSIIKVLDYASFQFLDAIWKRTQPKERICIIEEGAREYFLKNRDTETSKLMRQIRRLPGCSRMKLDCQDWLKMKETEDQALLLASEGRLGESDDPSLEGYKQEMRALLDENRMMIRFFSEYIYDEKPFDFHDAFEGKKLNGNTVMFTNHELFYRLLLRISIIRCYVSDEFKSRFDSWLNATAVGEESDDQSSPDDEQEGITVDFSELEKCNKVVSFVNMKSKRSKVKKIELLYRFVYDNFVQEIKAQNEWYALYKFMKTKKILDKAATTADFAAQMNAWFPDAKARCNRSEINRYNFLDHHKTESWETLQKELYPANVTARGVKAIRQHYDNMMEKYDNSL